LIEARIVEASDTFGKSLGVKFGAGAPNGFSLGGNKGMAIGSNYGSAVTGTTGPGTTSTTPFLSMPASSFGGPAPATFGISLFNAASSRFLALEISALEADGRGKIVSSPRVITADQVKASIEQGTEIPYQEASSSGATSVSFKKAVLKLEVTPQITPEGSIILDLDVSKDSRGAETLSGPAIDTKHIQTQALIENGGTVVIGGIFTMEETNTTNKVPLLGDLPGVGNLFKNRTKQTEKKELLVFISPKIVSERALGSR
jgi:type IV pilus assembly protein PilQ